MFVQGVVYESAFFQMFEIIGACQHQQVFLFSEQKRTRPLKWSAFPTAFRLQLVGAFRIGNLETSRRSRNAVRHASKRCAKIKS